MLKSFGQVPAGVWVGALILLASAWVKDGWGFVLGIVVIAATIVTTSLRTDDDEELPEAEVYDDGWGTEAGRPDEDK